MFGEDRWPSVRGSFGLAVEVVFFAFVEYGMCNKFFFYRLCIKFSICIYYSIPGDPPTLTVNSLKPKTLGKNGRYDMRWDSWCI